MSNLTVKGNASGTGTVILEAPNTNTNRTITLPDATATLASTAYVDSSVATAARMVAGTAVSSTSGTAIDFTGIPSWAKRVTVMLSGVSHNSAAGTRVKILLGTSGGVETTSYSTSTLSNYNGSITTGSTFVDGIYLTASAYDTSAIIDGQVVFSKLTGNTWALSGGISTSGVGPGPSFMGGVKTLSATLDRVRITTASGTDAFDAGTINIMYEG